MWNESVASRGSNEICSCLDHYVQTYLSHHVKRLVIFSDNCSGQNKNINVVLMYLRLVHSGKFDKVEHYFMEPGHSYLDNDRDFGNLELFMKGKEVYSTDDYVSVMRKARPNNPFTVIEMKTEDFFNYETLQNQCTKASQKRSGFKNAKRFIANSDNKSGVTVCARFDDDVIPPVFMKVQKGRSRQGRDEFNLSQVQLPLRYPNGRLLDKEKAKDLKDLMVFIPGPHEEFYRKLFSSQERLAEQEREGDDDEGVDDPEDDDHLEY